MLSKDQGLTPVWTKKELIKIWWATLRPKTLPASIVPVMVGSGLAKAYGGYLDGGIVLLALLVSLFIQTGINLTNDAIDSQRGADNQRIGPKRAVHAGLASEKTVWCFGVGCFGCALFLGLPLVQQGGIGIELMLLAAVILGYMYTGGSYSLAYLGLGDLFVILFFGLINTSAAFYLQTHALHAQALLAGLQVGLLATVMIAINNLRDREGDARVNKRTLSVRFGVFFSRIEITIASLTPFLLGVGWLFWGYVLAASLPIILLPLAIHNVWQVWITPPSSSYNAFLARAGMIQLLFGGLLMIGYLSV